MAGLWDFIIQLITQVPQALIPLPHVFRESGRDDEEAD